MDTGGGWGMNSTEFSGSERNIAHHAHNGSKPPLLPCRRRQGYPAAIQVQEGRRVLCTTDLGPVAQM